MAWRGGVCGLWVLALLACGEEPGVVAPAEKPDGPSSSSSGGAGPSSSSAPVASSSSGGGGRSSSAPRSSSAAVMPSGAVLEPLFPDPEPSGCNQLETLLRQRIPSPANCANGCAVVVPRTGTAQVLVRSDDAMTYWYPVATNWGWHFFTSYNTAAGTYALMAAPTSGGDAVTVQTFPAMTNLLIHGNADIGGTFVYAVSRQNTLGGPWQHTLHTWGLHSGQSTPLATLPARLKHHLVGVVSFAGVYVLSLEDGIHAVNMYTPNDVQQLYAGDDVTALHVEDTGRFYFATAGDAAVHAYTLFGDRSRVVAHLDGVTALAEHGVDSSLAVLNGDGVFLVDLAREDPLAPRLIYSTRAFPQFPWLRGLATNGDGAVYVGQVCHMDADAPGYATVKLDLPTPAGVTPQRPGGASWVTGTPQWPWETPVLDSTWGELGRTQGTALVIQHVGE